ncbi:MAG: DUF542 domain-containing protein [Chitinophagaceae bacterium]|nr:DUF542 domain-containing protein [Chitinophagaceae bacterium]
MFLSSVRIDRDAFVTDLVKQDYRTAVVFRKYGIEFCCSAKFPLSDVCANMGISVDEVVQDLNKATRPFQLPPAINFEEWDMDFLIDYILNVHHRYLRDRLPFINEQVKRFAAEFAAKLPEIKELKERYDNLSEHLIPHLKEEEEVLFPYVRQIVHAYADSEPYAGLLVRTLRKPMETTMKKEHEMVKDTLFRMRHLTCNYTPPENVCIGHRITFSLLRELDNDLTQHLYLENGILFPRALAMEKDLLNR